MCRAGGACGAEHANGCLKRNARLFELHRDEPHARSAVRADAADGRAAAAQHRAHLRHVYQGISNRYNLHAILSRLEAWYMRMGTLVFLDMGFAR